MKQKIPKIIHYCWFGHNSLTPLAKRCILSWQKYCPDYKIVEWNEENFDINAWEYTKEAYACKKWAFVSDVARLVALNTHGGIYLDTDVEIIKNIDDLQNYDAFSGFESRSDIAAGVMASLPHHRFIEELLKQYDSDHFMRNDGSLNQYTIVRRMTTLLKKYGLEGNNALQTVAGITLFPQDYFYPKDRDTKQLVITRNTYTIHHYDGSWLTEEDNYINFLRENMKKVFPVCLAGYLAKYVGVTKYHGFLQANRQLFGWLCRKK